MTHPWACGHARHPLNEWSKYGPNILYQPLEYWTRHAATTEVRAALADELRQRRLKCPACRTQDRRVRRAWTWVVIAFVAVLLVGWRAC